jgi:hypothetical protein
MKLTEIIKQLHEERTLITDVIVTLEHLAAGRGKRRRGRPPAWLAESRKGKNSQQATGAVGEGRADQE